MSQDPEGKPPECPDVEACSRTTLTRLKISSAPLGDLGSPLVWSHVSDTLRTEPAMAFWVLGPVLSLAIDGVVELFDIWALAVCWRFNMPIHDSTRVEAGDFHHSHQCWIVAIRRSLSAEQLDALEPGNPARAVRYASLHGRHDEARHSGEIRLLRKMMLRTFVVGTDPHRSTDG
jgi:hypothetical protein